MASNKTVQDVMTANPITLPRTASAVDAARVMRDSDIGPVIVTDGDRICGIVTDRDIVVRVVAAGHDPSATRVGDICTTEVAVVGPEDDVGDAVARMRDHHVRRVPVVVDGQPIGMFSLGDLVPEGDARSVLADITAAPPNK